MFWLCVYLNPRNATVVRCVEGSPVTWHLVISASVDCASRYRYRMLIDEVRTKNPDNNPGQWSLMCLCHFFRLALDYSSRIKTSVNEAHQNAPRDRGYRLMHIYQSQMECSERDGLVLGHGYDEDTAKYE